MTRRLALAFFLALPALALAQPSGEWTGTFALPSIDGLPDAVLQVGDVLYVGGRFGYAGPHPASGFAAYDLAAQEWSVPGQLGEGYGPTVRAIALAPDGSLYLGGEFDEAGGVSTSNIARYDSATGQWSALGNGIEGAVYALAIGPDGALWVGGRFGSASGVPVRNLARWDGSAWSNPGDVGSQSSQVNALAFGGDVLYVGGEFNIAGGVETEGVAQYDTATDTWAELGRGLDGGGVTSFVFGGGQLFVGGWYSRVVQSDGSVLTARRFARWDPQTERWSALPGGSGYGDTLVAGPDGALWAAGYSGLERWDGQAWTLVSNAPIISGISGILAPQVLVGADRLYYSFVGQVASDAAYLHNMFYSYDPFADVWGVLGGEDTDGVTDDVTAFASTPDGGVYAGGIFRFAGPHRADRVAYFDGETWFPLGQGVDEQVDALLSARDGSVYVGGRFGEAVQANGTVLPAAGIARWNPAAEQWTGLGGGLGLEAEAFGRAYALAEGPDGSVYVGGPFSGVRQPDGTFLTSPRFARWDGAQWVGVPPPGIGSVYALAFDAAGALYAASRNAVARLDPQTAQWTTLRTWTRGSQTRGGPFFDTGCDLEIIGDPMAGGVLYAALDGEGLWQWEGDVWTQLDDANARALARDGDPRTGGTLYVGGNRYRGFRQWDGVAIAEITSGSLISVFALDQATDTPAGRTGIWVGGEFDYAGGEPSVCIARWETNAAGGDVTITLGAPSEPVVVPAEGGSFPFALALVNSSDEAQTVEVWSEATFPDGSVKRPDGRNDLLGPVTVTLAPGDTLVRQLVQQVPGSIPAGDYVYTGYAGTFPDGTASSSFTGRKLADPGRRAGAGPERWQVTDAATGTPVLAGEHWSTTTTASPSALGSAVPTSLALSAGYPNPFRTTTELVLETPSPVQAQAVAYDVLGREVAVLLDGELDAGRHTLRFEATGVSAGVYVIHARVLSSSGTAQTFTQKLTLLR